jgi:beta-glucosidase
LPPFDDYSMSKRTYRYFAGEPLYPFGYGLSYTTFSYSNGKVSEDRAGAAAAADGATVSVDVTNSGGVGGDEVVQVYLTHPGVPGAPLRALKGFQRVHLEKGEKKTVTFNLGARDLSVVDESGKHRLVPGQVDVWVGGGQPVSRKGLAPAAGLKTQLTLAHAADLPD